MAGTRRFKKRRRESNGNKDNSNQDGKRKAYEPIARENEDFVKYYKKQEIVPEKEWDEFSSILKKDLPTAFRITACSKVEAHRLLNVVKGDFFEKLVNPDEAERKPPKPLPWYPDELAWQLDLTRKDIRRSELFFRLHNFLISETATGNISRQETVSMIPPLFLRVQPHHKVLDMCAAPGSKTAQLIEMLHSEQAVPDGLVVANDVDNSRCYMLVHQAKRLNSPAVLIVNHDATALPNFIIKDSEGKQGEMKFDRVLCDVPCTGDGTLRKNPDIWQKWNPANGSNLHGIQYRVVKRGVELLEVGGRLVYSTCSMNPVENEAVIARILTEANGSLELVDAKLEMPELKCRSGLDKWYPASKEVIFFTDYSEVEEKWQTLIRPHMFPPPATAALPLHRCIRILPHDQDSGCFFVAVLEKKSPHPWASACPDSAVVKAEKKKEKRRKIQGYREDPFVFFTGEEEIWTSIQKFYNIEGLDPTLLLTRCAEGKKKNIYLVTAGIKKIVDNNQERMKMINTGVKVFARCDNKSMGCSFRLVHEGLYTIESYIKGRRISLNKQDFLKLLENAEPKENVDLQHLTQETRDQAAKISEGSCLLDYREESEVEGGGLRLTLAGWRGVRSLRPYVTTADAVHYLRLLGQDVSKYEKNKFKKEESEEVVGESEEMKTEETQQSCEGVAKDDASLKEESTVLTDNN